MTLTIIIIYYHQTELLKRCLLSIARSCLPESYEILLVVNRADPLLEQFIKSTGLQIRTVQGEKQRPGALRNQALRLASGKIIYFLDDDVIVERNTLVNLCEGFARHQDCNVIGGPNLTPDASTLFQKCSGEVLASFFGSAGVSARYRLPRQESPADDRHLILCNLAIRRDALQKENFEFNESVVSNEENLLLQQLARTGHRMLLMPSVAVYHERRKTWSGFAAQIFKYGTGRGQMTRLMPRTLSLTHLLPAFFLGYLLLVVLLHRPEFFIPLAVYTSLALVVSLRIALKNRNALFFPSSMILFPTCHIAYATGFLKGILEKQRGRNTSGSSQKNSQVRPAEAKP
ncbi:MAG: glycosyltransferase [Candidatus Omnitrophota bacterium]